MFCENCGHKLNEGDRFCPECGTPTGENGFSDREESTQAGVFADAKIGEEASAEQAEEAPLKKRKERKTKKGRKGRAFLAVFFLLFFCVVAVLVFYPGSPVREMFFHQDDSASAEQSDDIDVGEIYYQEIDPEHVAETDSGMMYADNEILVVAQDGVTYDEIEKLAGQYEAEIVGWIEITGDYQWLLSSGTYTDEELEELAAELEKEDIIYSASVNAIVEMSTDAVQGQSGFYYGKKWQSDLQDYSDGEGKSWGIEVINTIPAWQLLAENPDTVPVRIGLIDNGFDEDHEDLGFAGVYYNEYFVPDTANSSSSHGTHVAGTMAASTSNKTGICGVYPYGDGNLYGVSVSGLQSYSENGSFLSSVIGQKIAFAELIFRNVKVINQSLGFNVYINKYTNEDGSIDYAGVLSYWNTHDYTGDELTAKDLADFLNRALDKGYDFVIVSAAGNDSASSIGHLESKYNSWLNMISEDDYPDVYNRIIVVGAVNADLQIVYYSNAGERVDIFAPGGDSNGYIYSTVSYSSIFDDRYGNKAGTSMAAPHVSGVAACVWAANNDLTGAEVKEIICSSSSSLCTSCNLIDAYIAVEKAINWETEETVVLSDVEESAEEVQYGGILGWVVNVEDEDVKIEDAQITVTNVDTGETETTTTDSSGHFELILTEGNYTLTVTAQGYEDYIWPNGNDFQDPIVVTNEGVKYLDDWIKMTPENTSSLYDEILETYCIGLSEGWDCAQFYEAGLGQMWGYGYYDITEAGYMFIDINGDGIDELLTGEVDAQYAYVGMFVDLFTIIDGKVTLVASSEERSRYYLCTNNLIAYEGSGSAMDASHYYFTFTGEERLSFIEGVEFDEHYDLDNPWFYSEVATKTKYGFSVSTDDYIAISQEEALNLINSYEHMELSFTPFSEYLDQNLTNSETNNVSQEYLREMLEAYTDEEILSFLYDDYDLNGTYEAFAFCGKAVDGEGYNGTLYFVTESGVQLVRAKEGYWTTGDILDLGSVKIFKINKYGATGGVFYLYQVVGDSFEELAASGKVTGAYYNSEGILCMLDSQYDASIDGTGHTWNIYYFYWDDGLKEYGGTLISEEEFLSYDGASDILNTIKADGYSVGAIYIRQNGIININASGGGRNVNVRVLYADGTVEVYPVGSDYYEDGIIYAAMISEIATY